MSQWSRCELSYFLAHRFRPDSSRFCFPHQEGYRQRRDLFCQLAAKHLTGLTEWHPPSAGMFVWFKVLGVTSTEKLIKERALAQKVPSFVASSALGFGDCLVPMFPIQVLLVPGSAFTPNAEASPFVRASFSTASPEEMDEALRRFATLLREELAGARSTAA